MTKVRSICPYCGVGCGVLVEVRRGRIGQVSGDPDHPTNRGGLCSKGQRLAEVVRARGRAVRPLIRPCIRGAYDRSRPAGPASWDDAIEAVAGGIRRSIDEHGPDSVALYLSGQLLTEDYYVANKLAKGLLRTANVDTNSRLCMSSTVAAHKRAFGADGPPGCYDDLDLASEVHFWGSNAAETHPILFGRLRTARERRGQRWIVIDPRRTPTAEDADEHLQLRPGTDVALALAMAAVLFQESLIDEEEVRRTCAGLDEVRAASLAMPPEVAAPICGVGADRIRGAARSLAAAPATLSVWCQGLNQSSAGTDKVNALINLHLLSGQIGRPGAGPFSLTGQANAMGGREVGGMATELAAHHGLDDPEDRAAVERFWGLGPVPHRRGLTAVELIDAIDQGKVKVLWVVCTNPLASLPDGWAARAALTKLDLLVVQEIQHPTDTSVHADVVLPAAGWSERTGVLTSSERRVALTERAVDPPGEARPDWEIFAAVAQALGGGDAFAWPDTEAVFAEHVRLTRGRDLDMTGLSHQLLRERGPQHWPFPEGGESQARRYLDGRYATTDGLARLVSIEYRSPQEATSEEFPLQLTTGRIRDQWHTMTRTGRVADLRREVGETVVHVNGLDADRAGVADGGWAMVSSPRGSLRARVRVDPDQPPGLLFLPFHRGPLHEPAGWVNSLLGRALDPISFQPELKHTVARLELVRGRIALAGGELAEAILERLAAAGTTAMLLSPEEMERVPPGVACFLIPGTVVEGLPWWELAGSEEGVPHPVPGAVAVLDLRHGPEPLAALPALNAAGWALRRRGDGGLPPPVLDLLAAKLPPLNGESPALVVGAPSVDTSLEAPPGTIVLEPGGQLGGHGPLTGDPATLAGYIAGRLPARAALRRVNVPLGRHSLVVVGDPCPREGTDHLFHIDFGHGLAQSWEVTSGEVVGAAAVVERKVAEDVETLWLADVSPSVLRSRLPLR